MLRKIFTFLKEAPVNAVWDISKWVFAGTVSVCAIIISLISNLPLVYAIPLIVACGIVLSLATWAAICSIQQFIPEREIPLVRSLEELKELRGELVHIFQLVQLSLLAKPLEALERLTWVLERSRIVIKRDVFTEHISGSDLNRYDSPYNEDDLINIEKQYQKKGYLENADAAGRALFRYLYERCKRLDEVIATINRPAPTLAASNDRKPVLVAVTELKGLRDEGNVMLGTFRAAELYGARPTRMDVEAYVKRLRAGVRQKALEISPMESATFDQAWPSGNVSDMEKPLVVREGFSGDESEVFDRLVDHVERLKELICTIENRSTS